MFKLKSKSSFTFSILFKPQSGMRFTTFFGVFAAATLVSARAIPLLYKRECQAQSRLYTTYFSDFLTSLQGCISALAAAGVTCAAAILEEGLSECCGLSIWRYD
jgi:hypothetical protein